MLSKQRQRQRVVLRIFFASACVVFSLLGFASSVSSLEIPYSGGFCHCSVGVLFFVLGTLSWWLCPQIVACMWDTDVLRWVRENLVYCFGVFAAALWSLLGSVVESMVVAAVCWGGSSWVILDLWGMLGRIFERLVEWG
jgi:hypothetical protein